MIFAGRLALLALLVGAGACGRSDLFSSGRHPGAAGGGGAPDGGGGGGGGSVDGGGPDQPDPCLAKPEICDNGIDDNCNARSDCADPGCFGDRACIKPGQEICNNRLDDDDDGRIDCADSDCADSLACRPQMGAEICDNGRDDNNDNLVDCSDPQCSAFPACLAVDCQVDLSFGTLAAHGARVSNIMDTSGSQRAFASCAPAGGHGRVGEFRIDQITDVRLDFSQPQGRAHVVSLFRAGANQACDQNLVLCLGVGQDANATHTFAGLGAGVYRVIVESFTGTEGSTLVTLSTGDTTHGVEICDNGIDDDQNGLIDCQDSACTASPTCAASQCVPDANVGALVVGATPQVVTVDTTTSRNRFHPTCAGNSTGPDRVVAFTLAEAGGVEVVYSDTGAHTFSFFEMPEAGLACDAHQRSCADLGMSSGDLAQPGLAAGKYLFVAKATGPGKGGQLTLKFSAFKNRPVEICSNGIDDDNNGLIDCEDPACFGVGTCTAAACTPDVDLGSLGWGTSKSVALDVKGGRNLYQTSCGRGDGKERVVRLTITQPMALGINCSETGSHVFQLSQQLNPLDACNANDFNCGDPEVLPFGCAYAVPNVQPGVYNLIVEAFQSGSEGTVQLTLTGFQEAIREICDNGIDDDKDGAIDCADLKCVTEPACAKFACRADQSLGILPLNGTGASRVVQTSAAVDDQKTTACTSAPGGQDAVLNFQLPALADLSIQWAQVGDHVFAIYADGGPLLACAASTSWACFPTAGAVTGVQLFPKLPAGKYHLVIDADRPLSEGGVILQVSALPAQ
jgi:hypothetical protein